MSDIDFIAGSCPKMCGRVAGFEVIGIGIWVVCTCGYRRLKYEVDFNGVLVETVAVKNILKLPKEGTRLRRCLLIIHSQGKATTREAACLDGTPSGDMATQLTLLEGKGLVRKLTSLRRVTGGSTWTLTDTALDLVNNK